MAYCMIGSGVSNPRQKILFMQKLLTNTGILQNNKKYNLYIETTFAETKSGINYMACLYYHMFNPYRAKP